MTLLKTEMKLDLSGLPELLHDLFKIVSRLEKMAPGRKFTLDGHLVGSIGEVLAAYCYGLELHAASNKGHDAKAADGRLVQIKLTQGKSVALSYDCDYLLVFHLDKIQGFSEVYNGPGAPAWRLIEGKAPVGRQRSISVSSLRKLATTHARSIAQVAPFPDVHQGH